MFVSALTRYRWEVPLSFKSSYISTTCLANLCFGSLNQELNSLWWHTLHLCTGTCTRILKGLCSALGKKGQHVYFCNRRRHPHTHTHTHTLSEIRVMALPMGTHKQPKQYPDLKCAHTYNVRPGALALPQPHTQPVQCPVCMCAHTHIPSIT